MFSFLLIGLTGQSDRRTDRIDAIVSLLEWERLNGIATLRFTCITIEQSPSTTDRDVQVLNCFGYSQYYYCIKFLDK